jgi:hypothetical protein
VLIGILFRKRHIQQAVDVLDVERRKPSGNIRSVNPPETVVGENPLVDTSTFPLLKFVA